MPVHHDDEHLIAVEKPAGVNTHRADTHAQDGLCEWLGSARQESLSVVHRLDKGTSGLLLLGRTATATRALSEQFAARTIKKRYLFLTPVAGAERAERAARMTCDEAIAPRGSGRKRRKGQAEAKPARTGFRRLEAGPQLELWEARPETGRTHQVRLHAARLGLPIVGDPDYGGAHGARLFLHAAGVEGAHPAGGALALESPLPESFRLALGGAAPAGPRVAARAALEARRAVIDAARTDSYLWIDRDHDGFPDLRVERLGSVARILRYDQRGGSLPPAWIDALMQAGELTAVVEQRRPRAGEAVQAAAVAGSLSEPRFEVRELGLRYWVDLAASTTSSGLFLDQRETRRRILASDLAGKTVLNAFAHTGSLSVAAARAGAETLTLDLSKSYLDWARENLALNGLDPAEHDFIYGDALDWLRRLSKKGRTFDLVLLDPPSFSTRGKGRKKQRWSVDRDLAALVERGARLTAPGGTLYVSTNLRRLPWPGFLERVEDGLAAAGRRGAIETATLPLDHRSGPSDPPYLKAAWIRLGTA